MKRLHRRSFLTLAGAAAAVPALLRPRHVLGADGAAPKRLVFFCTPNGTNMGLWPSSVEALGPILEPLAPIADRLTLLRGLDVQSAFIQPVPRDHLPDWGNALTGRQPRGENGYATGASIDHVVAAALGGAAPLHFGVQSDGGAFWAADNVPLKCEHSPYVMYDALFGDLRLSSHDRDRLRAQRRSAIDLARDYASDLRCAMGAEHRHAFDAHLDGLRALERRLGAEDPMVACRVPDPAAPIDLRAEDNFPAIGRLHMDLVAMTLACDLTRVVGLMWHYGGSELVMRWAGLSQGYHHVTHGNPGVSAQEQYDGVINAERWYAEQFLYLAQALDRVPEGDGTLLDHTALVWVHEQAVGGTHQRTDMPYVVAGGCGGALRTRQSLSLGGRPHADLLVTLANAMDVPMASFGDERIASAPIAELL